MKQSHPLKKLILFIMFELLFVFGIVWFFDPFYQYHAPFGTRKAVLHDRDNQVVGTIRNFSYDSVLLGSSLAENFDSSYLDAQYECQTLKIIKASGSLSDLLCYLDMAQEHNELRNVFWCLDMNALESSPVPTVFDGVSPPKYLRTETLLDDIPYIYNKEVIFEEIPLMFAYAHLDKNTGGDAYNWADGKEFSASRAMQAYAKPESVVKDRDFTVEMNNLAENLSLLSKQLSGHPDTNYYFIIPPYSLLWWDCAYVNGELEKDITILEQTLPVLLSYDNVEIYYFQSEKDIVCNPDYYMDMIHYSPDISQYMLEQLAYDDHKITPENYREKIAEMQALANDITTDYIYDYYP